ncbi:unnamed protein product [Sphagnum jensenii]|uniref:Rapamycin-insensitive companion of mTOR N-terminal domain-containing protein n=1 Tax=Sphagnum jensenii TaxID=128206 RepID=A0ABP1A4R3_9BRYO
MLEKILLYLRASNRTSGKGSIAESRELLAVLNTESNDLAANPPNSADFATFLKKIHDLLVTAETTIKSAFLRVIRLSMSTKSHCESIVSEEIDWVIITSLERDSEQVILERMQALKLIKKFISIAPTAFPVSFARSLVAIANSKDDNIRRVCIEILRELSVVNPEVVTKVNGFSCLLEAVLDPSTNDMGESIVLSLLYLMNSQSTSVDYFVLCVTEQPLPLTETYHFIPQVSMALQEVILEAFTDILEPVISRVSEEAYRTSILPSTERGRENSVFDPRTGESTKKSSSYMTSFLRAAAPFSPAFLRKNSGPAFSKDRSVSEAMANLNVPGGAHRASQLLLSLADTFSVAPYSFSTGVTVEEVPPPATGVVSVKLKRPSVIVNNTNTGGGNNTGRFIPPNTVKFLKDLAVEMKLSCMSSSTQNNINYYTSSNFSLLQDLNAKFINTSDKLEFRKQIEASKTIGKEVRLIKYSLCSSAIHYTPTFSIN